MDEAFVISTIYNETDVEAVAAIDYDMCARRRDHDDEEGEGVLSDVALKIWLEYNFDLQCENWDGIITYNEDDGTYAVRLKRVNAPDFYGQYIVTCVGVIGG